MGDVYFITFTDGSVHHVVYEEDYFKVLLAMGSIMGSRRVLRSFEGLALAMAQQWGGLL